MTKVKKLTWSTRQFKVKELIPMEDNPRTITEEKEEKLDRSLAKFDLVEIPAVNQDMRVIAANQRVKRLMAAGRGEEVIDVRYPSRMLTDEEVKEYAVISNTHAGEFDFEILNDQFGDLDFEDIGFDIHGFDQWKMQQDLEAAKEAVDDDYEIPDEVHPDVVPGDLIEIGDHRLYCGSATEMDAYEKLTDGQLMDLVITDPPYNVDYTGKTKDALKIQNDKKTDDEFYQFLYDFYTAAGAYTKSGGAWYVWHADSEGANFRKAMADAGIMVKQCLIWVKNNMVMGRQDYHWQHEPCLYGWKEGAAHGWYSDRKQTTVLRFDRPQRNAEHPTMKPIPLIAYQMGNSSKGGDLVGDFFVGSGTTMVTCEQMGRKCYAMEIDPVYCQVTIDRMHKFNPSLKIKINGKEYKPKE
jgi:DNA modification methylase